MADGEAAWEYALEGDYDAIILDILMPKMDGLEVLRRLRQAHVQTPVMLLTAKGQTEDRIHGFDAGADDYLPKPFDPDELLSRLRAMLRRTQAYLPDVLQLGNTSLNTQNGMLQCGAQMLRLSSKEFQILELFMRSPQVVISAERLLERIWGWESETEVNVIWVHISNLRKKLKGIGSNLQISANRGLGYLLEVGK